MNKPIIRPFNTGIAFAVLASIVLLVKSLYELLNVFMDNESSLILGTLMRTMAFIYIFILVMYVALKPRIMFFKDRLIIHHWKYGTPYRYGHDISVMQFVKFPEVLKTTIFFKDIAFFGAYTASNISEYIGEDSGFLKKQWIVSNVGVPIKLPKIVSKLRGVLLFVKKSGDSVIVDGKAYSVRQTAGLLAIIEDHVPIKASGIIDADHKQKQFFLLDALRSISLLIVSITWCIIIPISLVGLEGVLNVGHSSDYQSPFRILYIVGFMLANLSLIGVIIFKRKDSSGNDAQRVAIVFKTAVIILYPFSIFAFIASILF